MPRTYFLTQKAIDQLRYHKKWSVEQFGHIVTKKYFQDINLGFQYIVDNYKRFQVRPELVGKSGFSIYPIREHYIVYTGIPEGVLILAVLGRTQDIPTILTENAAVFQRELAQYPASSKAKPAAKKRKR